MKLKPELDKVYVSGKSIFTALGPVWSIAILIIIGILGWYLFSYASEGWKEHQANKQIAAYQAEADKQKAIADQKQKDADQALGAAAAYKQQADELQQERSILLNARPELQSKINAASKQSEAIRNRPLNPVTDDMRQRVSDLGSKLDKLYPGN